MASARRMLSVVLLISPALLAGCIHESHTEPLPPGTATPPGVRAERQPMATPADTPSAASRSA